MYFTLAVCCHGGRGEREYLKRPSSITAYIHIHPCNLCLPPIPPFMTAPDRQEGPCMTTNSCRCDENRGFRHMKFKPAHSQSWTSTFVRQTFCQTPLDLNYLPSNTTPGHIRHYALWMSWKTVGICLLRVFFSFPNICRKHFYFKKSSVLYYALQVGFKNAHMQFRATSLTMRQQYCFQHLISLQPQ